MTPQRLWTSARSTLVGAMIGAITATERATTPVIVVSLDKRAGEGEEAAMAAAEPSESDSDCRETPRPVRRETYGRGWVDCFANNNVSCWEPSKC